MSDKLRKDLEDLLTKHAIADVLGGLAEIMQEPGGDDDLILAVGGIIEKLTAQALWKA